MVKHWLHCYWAGTCCTGPGKAQAAPFPACPPHVCRPYLRQRTHSAVCYLQTAGVEFGGGTFQFEQGADGTDRPQDVLASPGRVVGEGGAVALSACIYLAGAPPLWPPSASSRISSKSVACLPHAVAYDARDAACVPLAVGLHCVTLGIVA